MVKWWNLILIKQWQQSCDSLEISSKKKCSLVLLQCTIQNSFFSYKLFNFAIFRSKGIVYASEGWNKILFPKLFFFLISASMQELSLEFVATVINYVSLSFLSLKKTYSGNCRFLKRVTLRATTTADWIYCLNVSKREPRKTFRNRNIEF